VVEGAHAQIEVEKKQTFEEGHLTVSGMHTQALADTSTIHLVLIPRHLFLPVKSKS
jgi:hypothetical protein